MAFPQRLASRRKEHGMTQQVLAERTGINVSQIRRYETGKTQPTLAIIRKLALGLGSSSDALVFDHDERGPSDELRPQFEAASTLDDEERKILKAVIEGILLKDEARRLAAIG